MIACVLFISLEAAGKTDEDEDFNSDDTMGVSQIVAGMLAIFCGLSAAIMMSTKHMFIRLYKSCYSGVDMGFDSSMCEFFLMMFFLIPLSQSDEFTITYEDILIGSIAGILICSGRICISIGVSLGKAGPA